MTRMPKSLPENNRLPQRLNIECKSKPVSLVHWPNTTMLSKYPIVSRRLSTHLPDLSRSPINSPSTPNLSPDFSYPLELCNEDTDQIEPPYPNKDFKIVKKLGEGATSQVYLAIPLNLNIQLTALKVVHKSAGLDQLVIQETDVLKQLNHENIIKLLDYQEDVTNHYIATEYCKDGDLFDYVDTSFQKFTLATVVTTFIQCVSAVQYLHSKKFVHRDLKLENFLVASISPLKIKLADFGMAVHTSSPLPMSQLPKGGSDQYLAPELLISSDYLYDLRRCDVYGLGVLLYSLLFNKLPFNCIENDAKSRKAMLINIFNGKYTVPNQMPVEGSQVLVPLMKQMMSTKPEKRLDLNQVLETLNSLI